MKISELRQARAKAADDLMTLVDDAEAFETKKAEVEALDGKIKRAEEAQAKAAETAQPVEGQDNVIYAQVKGDSELVKKAPLAKMVAGMMEKHTGGALSSDAFLKTAYGDDMAAIVKSTHQVTDYATGGALSLPDFAETIIDGLENLTVVRSMQPQVLTVPGTMILPREDAAPSGSWLGENAAPTPGNFEFGEIRLDPKRLPIEVVISRKLLDVAARGGAAVRNLEGFIVRRLRERLAVNEDAGFLRGAGTQNVPLGIRNQIAAGNIKAIAGTTAANIETDLRSRVTKLQEANIMITAGYWLMAPRTRASLADLRDANGNKIYASIDVNNTLLGYQIKMTNQVPVNLGAGGNESEIIFVNGPSIIVANGKDAEVRVSIEGSYQSGSSHYSLIQRNEMLVHLELEADAKMERDAAISVLTGVTY